MDSFESRHRLKQKDLVATLLVLFSEEYDKTEVASIIDIELPMNTVREYLEKQVGIQYSSDTWIITQIHKYETENGIKLFRKRETPEGSLLGLNYDIRTYNQKKHLYVTQKIRVANGIFDLIKNQRGIPVKGETISLLLGAGSTVTRVAEIIAENLRELPYNWRIYTHNLGVIENLGKTTPGYEKVEILVPEGRFDPITNLILGNNELFYSNTRFDWIVQGASFISSGNLYVESEAETKLKSFMLHNGQGKKILALTGHETASRTQGFCQPFGSINEYDFIVIPTLQLDSPSARKLSIEMKPFEKNLSMWIRNWSYEIFRVQH